MCGGGKVTGTIIKFDRTIYTNSFFDIATYGVLTFFCPFVFSSFFFCLFLWFKHTPSIITHLLHTSPRLNHVQPVDHRSLPSFLAIPFFSDFLLFSIMSNSLNSQSKDDGRVLICSGVGRPHSQPIAAPILKSVTISINHRELPTSCEKRLYHS